MKWILTQTKNRIINVGVVTDMYVDFHTCAIKAHLTGDGEDVILGYFRADNILEIFKDLIKFVSNVYVKHEGDDVYRVPFSNFIPVGDPPEATWTE